MESMDRPIPEAQQRRNRVRRMAIPTAAALIAIVAFVQLIGWLRPGLRRDRIRTAIVQRAEVAATIDASGRVVPEFEHVLTAPMATRVKRILKTSGSSVKAGEPIVLLDDRDASRDLEQLEEQVALKRNQQQQTRLELDRTRDDLMSRHEIKALELESLRFEYERNQEMFKRNLIVQDDVRKAKADLDRATIELRHLESQLVNSEKDLQARLEGLALEISIMEKDRDRARELLDRITVKSDRPGIVTWVVTSEGAAVPEGEPIARVADLTAYRVDATLSDVLARKLTVGLPALVRTGDTRLTGRVYKILPTVENGIVTFEVVLDDKSHPVLRPNLRVDVHAVTDQHKNALCIDRGPIVHVDGQDCVYVVRDDRAMRTPVTIGLANFEVYEITEGLEEGDEVIISDMSEYRHTEEVKIQ